MRLHDGVLAIGALWRGRVPVHRSDREPEESLVHQIFFGEDNFCRLSEEDVEVAEVDEVHQEEEGEDDGEKEVSEDSFDSVDSDEHQAHQTGYALQKLPDEHARLPTLLGAGGLDVSGAVPVHGPFN